ncbi:MAG: alpha/beta fold hydrolase [Mycobacterium leprae]
MTGRNSRRTRPADSLSRGSVLVDGESLFYEASGSDEKGRTLLFLHDSGGSSSTWQGQLSGLAERARCLAPDFPGHGRSEGTSFTTVAEYRRSIEAFLDALAIRWPVVVAGASLGAAVAVDLALHAPKRVEGLILAGPTAGGRCAGEVVEATARGEAPESFVTGLFGPNVHSQIVRDRLKRWRLTSPLARHADLTAVTGYQFDQAVQGVRHPVLFVAGGADSLASPEQVQALAVRLPDASVATIPGAGCLSMLEEPLLFNRQVAGFVAKLSPTVPVLSEERQPGGYWRF